MDCNVNISDFWNLDMYELDKLYEAYKRQLQIKAQYNYTFALNITNNLGMLLDKKCKLLPIEKYYPIFENSKSEMTEDEMLEKEKDFAVKMESLYKYLKPKK